MSLFERFFPTAETPLTFPISIIDEKLEKGQVRGIVVCLPWKRVAKKKIVHTTEKESA